ncbi:hypothetical protein LTS18_012967, partial [Coniosporium uncinatum]
MKGTYPRKPDSQPVGSFSVIWPSDSPFFSGGFSTTLSVSQYILSNASTSPSQRVFDEPNAIHDTYQLSPPHLSTSSSPAILVSAVASIFLT